MAKGHSLPCETQGLARAGPYRLKFQRDPHMEVGTQAERNQQFLPKVPKELGQKSPVTTKLETKACRTMETAKTTSEYIQKKAVNLLDRSRWCNQLQTHTQEKANDLLMGQVRRGYKK